MASGYFPLNHKDDEGAKILEALKLLMAAQNSLWTFSYGELCAEDAAIDGRYLADLGRGINMIASCLEGHVSHERLSIEAIREINRYLPPDSGITEHEALCNLIEIFDGPLYRAAKSGLPLGSEETL